MAASCVLRWTHESDLPELVVDHHVVGLHVPVHDAHAVAVVQSLGDMSPSLNHSTTNRLLKGTSRVRLQEAWRRCYLQQLVHVVADVVIRQLLVQLLSEDSCR